jgi:regulator of PEP synthase PpsR (kinase-PPPase family)
MSDSASRYFHVHLVSDSTGEGLRQLLDKALLFFPGHSPIVHMHTLVRSPQALAQVLERLEEEPGLVVHALSTPAQRQRLEAFCQEQGLPCMAALDALVEMLSAYLNTHEKLVRSPRPALDEHYFARMRALDYAMMHDDGQNTETLDEADIILIGLSRTSKTPTSIYLANQGYRTANIPFVAGQALPEQLFRLKTPLIVGLVASTQTLSGIRRNRLADIGAEARGSGVEAYADRRDIAREVQALKTLCARHDWPVIDVTRRAVEETAAMIVNLHRRHREKLEKES